MIDPENRQLLKVKELIGRIGRAKTKIDISSLVQICQKLQVHGHIAIFEQPYLSLVMCGKKTVDSRFSRLRGPPFNGVNVGDIIFVKEKSGPIRAIASVSKVKLFGPLKPGEARRIMIEFQQQLMLADTFIERKSNSIYSTLIYLNRVCLVEPFFLNKSDRRPWIVLDHKMAKSGKFVQSQLFPNPDCTAGLHSYHGSDFFNSHGYPVCKICGADLIDWKRVHRLDINDHAYTVSQLRTDKFRYGWWKKEIDQVAKARVLTSCNIRLKNEVMTRLRRSVGEVHEDSLGMKRPYRDGYQTPFSGNIIFYAQHALACCCRKCMNYWHGIPYGRDLSQRELEYFADLVMIYIRERMSELGKCTEADIDGTGTLGR